MNSNGNTSRMVSEKEATIISRKQQERDAEEINLQKEEAVTRKLIKKMVNESDPRLSHITEVLVHFEGNFNYLTIMLFSFFVHSYNDRTVWNVNTVFVLLKYRCFQ